jgi:P27 family predicted phage terminase small subunit
VKEKKIWEHVTQALREYGLIHRTDAMVLTIICRTFVRWVEAEEQLTKLMKDNDGSYFVKTPNGYEQPHQIFFVARNIKADLLKWLPEAALTIPSFQKAMAASGPVDQGQLPGFEDPVMAHRDRKIVAGMRVVK